ncbi:MAG: nucleotidyltransferase domain-containing protein [Pyrobaculum sp.]
MARRYYRGRKREVLDKLRRALEAEDKVLLAVVFGSFARDQWYRDVDVAVYTTDRSLDYLLKLGAKLELELGIPVDVVPIEELSPTFRIKILTQGTVVVDKAPRLYEALLNMAHDDLIRMRRTP